MIEDWLQEFILLCQNGKEIFAVNNFIEQRERNKIASSWKYVRAFTNYVDASCFSDYNSFLIASRYFKQIIEKDIKEYLSLEALLQYIEDKEIVLQRSALDPRKLFQYLDPRIKKKQGCYRWFKDIYF